jgi:hypothetical protein
VLAKKLGAADAKVAALQTPYDSSSVDDEAAVEAKADGCFDLGRATDPQNTAQSPSSGQATTPPPDERAAPCAVASRQAALAAAEAERGDLAKRAREVAPSAQDKRGADSCSEPRRKNHSKTRALTFLPCCCL